MRGVEMCSQSFGHQLLPCADSLDALLQIDKEWSAKAERPFDPYLTPKGEQQAKAVAAQLQKFDLKRVYVSPFLRFASLQRSPLCQIETAHTHTAGTEQSRLLAAMAAMQRRRDGESCIGLRPKPAPGS